MPFDRLEPDVISALIEAQFKHAQARLILNNETTPISSTLLGFDYYENAILLDGLHPPIADRLLKRLQQAPFWLQIKVQSGYLHILCIIKSVQHDLYTLELIDGDISLNRRWHPRVSFSARKGPKVHISQRDLQFSDAYIKDISISGAQILVYGAQRQSALQKNASIHLSMQFNDQFSLGAQASVLRQQWQRTPNFHSVLRVKFSPLEAHARGQLQHFIDALTEEIAA